VIFKQKGNSGGAVAEEDHRSGDRNARARDGALLHGYYISVISLFLTSKRFVKVTPSHRNVILRA
jgi:hypothetical protein